MLVQSRQNATHLSVLVNGQTHMSKAINAREGIKDIACCMNRTALSHICRWQYGNYISLNNNNNNVNWKHVWKSLYKQTIVRTSQSYEIKSSCDNLVTHIQHRKKLKGLNKMGFRYCLRCPAVKWNMTFFPYDSRSHMIRSSTRANHRYPNDNTVSYIGSKNFFANRWLQMKVY